MRVEPTKYQADRKLTLLIVDDEEQILKMLARLFRSEFRVVTANGGQEGLKKFDEERPELVLSDQRMAGMTGIEMLKTIAEKEPGTVRILITGYSDIDAVIEAVNHKLLDRYVTKPWNNDELVEIVKEGAVRYLKNAGIRPRGERIYF
ncbi:MAG TPA: response regulator [Haliangium sp.]|nr:response regulator [Haliangium sp.]